MRFALDCHVARLVHEELTKLGHEIVVVARAREADADWFARALEARAEVVISGDRAFNYLCRSAGVQWVKLRGGSTPTMQLYRIHDFLTRPSTSVVY